MMERVEKEFGKLLLAASKLPENRYRFAVLHRFREFDGVVWVTPIGRRVKIIT